MTSESPSGRAQSEYCGRFDAVDAWFDGAVHVTVRGLHAEYATGTEVTDRIDYLLYHADQPRAEGASRALVRGRQVPSSRLSLVALLAGLRASRPTRLHVRGRQSVPHGNPCPVPSPNMQWASTPPRFSCRQARRLCSKLESSISVRISLCDRLCLKYETFASYTLCMRPARR